MSEQLYQNLRKLSTANGIECLGQINHGIEKESLRVDPQGSLAKTAHPSGLGSALTHATITTDFSEALMEFITPVYTDPRNSIGFLSDLHSFAYTQLPAEELLWTSSMPCVIGKDENIPLAQYGSSNTGKLKTLYRNGLGFRYGRTMQTIAGIHYNFSMPEEFWELYHNILNSDESLQDFKTSQYFCLIRNFRRYSWLLLYLFGASPALCKSFVKDRPGHGLDSFDEHSLFAPFATSLRMGDLGYTSKAQASLYISYNSLDEYASGLLKAIKTSYEPYSHFKTADGSPTQLNNSILQIENEFYSTIRPKRVTGAGVRPVHMLREKGVEYIEVRLLDLNPFLPVGIDEEQMQFLNCFLIFCLLRNSPPSNRDEYHEIDNNLQSVVRNGRDPELQLHIAGQARGLRQWATEIMQEVGDIASLLDTINKTTAHKQAAATQQAKIDNADLTPSAKVLQRMREGKTSYFRFAMNQSLANSDYFRSRKLSEFAQESFQAMTKESLAQQQDVESSDTVDFETYLDTINQS